jgi:hypothetical protein
MCQILEVAVLMNPAEGFRTFLIDTILKNVEESGYTESTPVPFALMYKELGNTRSRKPEVQCSRWLLPDNGTSKEAPFTQCPKTSIKVPGASFVGGPLEEFPEKSWCETNMMGIFINLTVPGA